MYDKESREIKESMEIHKLVVVTQKIITRKQ